MSDDDAIEWCREVPCCGTDMCSMPAADKELPGAWLVYDYDRGPYAISIHADAATAARVSARQGYGKVGFWPLGSELREAVDAWEAQS